MAAREEGGKPPFVTRGVEHTRAEAGRKVVETYLRTLAWRAERKAGNAGAGEGS